MPRPISRSVAPCTNNSREAEHETGYDSCTPSEIPTLGTVSAFWLYTVPGMWFGLLNMCASKIEFRPGSGSIEGWVRHTGAGNGSGSDTDVIPGATAEPYEPKLSPPSERRPKQ